MSTAAQHLSFPATDLAAVGPPVGSRFPNVRLPDQHGRIVDLHPERNGRKAVVVFHRSAKW